MSPSHGPAFCRECTDVALLMAASYVTIAHYHQQRELEGERVMLQLYFAIFLDLFVLNFFFLPLFLRFAYPSTLKQSLQALVFLAL